MVFSLRTQSKIDVEIYTPENILQMLYSYFCYFVYKLLVRTCKSASVVMGNINYMCKNYLLKKKIYMASK